MLSQFEYCFKLIQVRLLDSLASLLFVKEDRDLVAVPVGLGVGKWSMMVKIIENRGLGSWHCGIVPLVLRYLPHLPNRKIVPLKCNKYSIQPFQWKGVTIYSSCDLFLSLSCEHVMREISKSWIFYLKRGVNYLPYSVSCSFYFMTKTWPILFI